MLSIKKYNYKSWTDFYKDKEIDISQLQTADDWHDILKKEEKYLDEVNKINKMIIDHKYNTFPYPQLVFNAFKLCHFKNLKVVILGQDPYFNIRNKYPEAMGLSFSVPIGVPIPSSLKNIYKNMVYFKHLPKIPDHGNLENWAIQGVLLLNTALTVQEDNPNSHKDYWKTYTDNVIKSISDNCDKIIFVLWGANARDKQYLINSKKHHIMISSHPSGHSCARKLGQYPAFNSEDHFGEINKYLSSKGKKEIIWNSLNIGIKAFKQL